MGNERYPATAGSFYPGNKDELLRMLQTFIAPDQAKEEAIAVMSPHAGYPYSGGIAGEVFSRVVISDTVIIIGPNHSGYGQTYAVDSADSWVTSLGDVPVDCEMRKSLLENSRYLAEDLVAHEDENSIETQVPFLKYLNRNVKIVPIALGGFADVSALSEIGNVLAGVIQSFGKNVLIVASSDMNHYENQQITEEKDKYALDAVLSLDENLLAERVSERRISMCGCNAVIAAIVAAKKLGAKRAELVNYRTSGDVTGDYSQVVGYAGVIIR